MAKAPANKKNPAKESAPVAEKKLTKKEQAELAAKQQAEQEAAEAAKQAAEKPAKGKGKGKAEKPAKEQEKQQEPEQEEEEQEAEEKATKGKPRSLNAITKAISKKILASAKASVEIGLLLQEGKDAIEFKHSKGATKVFLEWAEQEFGIYKAQAYNYLKVASVFGSEELQEKFASVPMRVLGRLTMNEDMLDAARIAIEEGVKVDSKWMQEWLEGQKEPEEKEPKEPKNKGGKDSDHDTDTDDEDGDEDEKPNKRQEMDDKLVTELESEIEALKAKLESAGSGVVAQDHFQAVAKRFSKMQPYQVLGVAPDADKKAVKAAMREMVKLYHPDIVGASGAEVVAMVEAAAKAMTK